MNNQPLPTAPLFAPFRVEQFRFKRQEIIAGDLVQLPLFLWFSGQNDPVREARSFLESCSSCTPLPDGCCPRLDEAINHLRTATRSHLKFKTVLEYDRKRLCFCNAVRQQDTITFVIPAHYLARPTARHLVYHLALAFFHAHNPFPRLCSTLLRQQFPLHVVEREHIIELLRLNYYLAHCFGFLCTGDPELAARENYYRATGNESEALGLDLRQFALRHLKLGELTSIHFLENPVCVTDYLPGLPLVLDRFQESALHHAFTGQSGGKPMAEFEAEVLALDRRLHPPCQKFSDYHEEFFRLALAMGVRYTMERTGPVTADREEAMAEVLDTNLEDLSEFLRIRDFDVGRPRLAATALEKMASSRLAPWLNLHAVEILFRARCFALAEGHTEYSGDLRDALEFIGGCCHLTTDETRQVWLAMRQTDAKTGQETE